MYVIRQLGPERFYRYLNENFKWVLHIDNALRLYNETVAAKTMKVADEIYNLQNLEMKEYCAAVMEEREQYDHERKLMGSGNWGEF
jgi:hypothetical protein